MFIESFDHLPIFPHDTVRNSIETVYFSKKNLLNKPIISLVFT